MPRLPLNGILQANVYELQDQTDLIGHIPYIPAVFRLLRYLPSYVDCNVRTSYPFRVAVFPVQPPPANTILAQLAHGLLRAQSRV